MKTRTPETSAQNAKKLATILNALVTAVWIFSTTGSGAPVSAETCSCAKTAQNTHTTRTTQKNLCQAVLRNIIHLLKCQEFGHLLSSIYRCWQVAVCNPSP